MANWRAREDKENFYRALLVWLILSNPVRDLAKLHYVAVFLVDVEKIREVGRFRSVSYALFRHDAVVAILQSIDAGGAHAAAGRAAGNDQSVDPHARESRLQMSAEKPGGIFFDDRDVFRCFSQARIDLHPFGAGFEPT